MQQALRGRWHGYLPPGSCLITPLQDAAGGAASGAGDGNPFGASCIAVLPTMRYPVDVRWHQDLVYNAMWSLLVELGRWNAEAEAEVEVKATHDEAQTQAQTTRRRRTIIERVLMTGLGTGTGQVSAARCAQQMILAIKHFAQDDMPKEADWGNVDGVIKQVNATLEL